MGLLLLMAAVTATAQNVFSIKDTTVKAGETVTLELALENTDAITALQFDLTFPQGLELQESSVQLNSDRIMSEHVLEIAQQSNSVTWRFVIVSESNGNKPLVKNSGTLISLPVKIGEGFKNSALTMSNVVLTDRKGNGLSYSAQMGLISIEEKKMGNLQILGLEQVVNTQQAAVISWIPKEVEAKDVTVGYFTNEACSSTADDDARKKAGVFYVTVDYAGCDTLNALKDTFVMVVNNKKMVDLSVKGTVLPTASTIMQGQSLSASILSGGKVLIASATDTIPLPGTFAWQNGNDVSTVTGQYGIRFTPEDNANYAVKDTSILLTVIPVYTVFISNPENGSISAEGISSNNRYADGQALFLRALPASNYRFVKWSNGVETDTTTWKVTQNATISAVFTPITRTVTINADAGGKLSIKKADGSPVVSGDKVQQGTELNITVMPDDTESTSYRLASLQLNGKDFTSGKYILGKEDVTFSATFAKVENEYPLTVEQTANGVVRLYKADGTAIPSGTAMKDGETFKVIALPNAGYELKELLIDEEKVDPDSGETNIFTGKSDEGALIEATFTPKKYTLTIDPVTGGTMDVTDGNGTSLPTNSSIEYGSTVKIGQPVANDGYKFRSLVVNGRKIEAFPAILTVGSDLNISASFDELTTIKDSYIINAVQSYTFNNQDKEFIIWTTQTYATDFNVAYKKVVTNGMEEVNGIPVKAGTYNMAITRPADDIYKAYTSGTGYFDGKLEIKKAKIAVQVAPTGTAEGNRGKVSVDTTKVETSTTGNVTTFTYIPKDADNYENAVYYLSTGEKKTISTGNKVWYDKSDELKSARQTKAGGVEDVVEGYVKVSNGGLPYSPGENGFSIAEGTKITLEAIPGEGYKFVKWKSDGNTNAMREVEVSSDLTTLPEAEFAKKGTPKASLTSTSSAYTGAIQEVATNITDARINIYKDRECTQIAELKNAGTYYISVYRSLTDDENEVCDTLEYKIAPAVPTVVAPTTMEIAAGETLAQVQMLGGNAGSVPGTFSWKDSTMVVKSGTNNYVAVFTSADPNYSSKEDVSVAVTGLSATKSNNPGPGTDPGTDPDPNPGTDPDVPTSIEEIASETLLVVQGGSLVIYPCTAVDIAVISIDGKYIFRDKIEGTTRVRVPQSGVYVVSFMNEGKKTSRKVCVF